MRPRAPPGDPGWALGYLCGDTMMMQRFLTAILLLAIVTAALGELTAEDILTSCVAVLQPYSHQSCTMTSGFCTLSLERS